MLKEVKERFYRRQPDVACLWRVPAVSSRCSRNALTRSESSCSSESEDGFVRSLVDCELEQKLEAVSIGIACVLAGASVTREIITQEGFDVGATGVMVVLPPT